MGRTVRFGRSGLVWCVALWSGRSGKGWEGQPWCGRLGEPRLVWVRCCQVGPVWCALVWGDAEWSGRCGTDGLAG
jgi:hypothetical protein